MKFVIWTSFSDGKGLVIKRLFWWFGGSGFALKCIQMAPLNKMTVK